jgi:hypothetical protein
MPDLPKFARFWMVCRKPTGPHSKTEPRRRYSRLADARDTAEQLAAKEDAQYLILEAVEIIHPTDRSMGLPL